MAFRKPGEFCWINILTPDPAKAQKFFSDLLGWTWVDMPGVGYRMQLDGKDIGGLFDLNGPNTPPGTPPVMGVMVKVKSADATVAEVAKLGGKALPPMDVFDAGRMAVCFDPTGANLDVWEPKAQQGMDVDPTKHGAPSWFELTTKDTDAAREFYTKLFGWKAEAMPMPGFTYTTLEFEGNKIAGIMPVLPEMGDMPSFWCTYFTVNDTDAVAAKATSLGGTVFIEPSDIPQVGRFAGIVSPQGVMFMVIRYLQPQ